jgi:hypothetical protein
MSRAGLGKTDRQIASPIRAEEWDVTTIWKSGAVQAFIVALVFILVASADEPVSSLFGIGLNRPLAFPVCDDEQSERARLSNIASDLSFQRS